MYIQSVEIENVGPIDYLKKQFSFNEQGNPIPLIIIGQNGAGKSIFISHIVNALISAKQTIYENSEVEQGKVFKYRSPQYIKTGKQYFRSKVTFENNFFQTEWQLDRTKEEFENIYKYTPLNKEWINIENNSASHIDSDFRNRKNELSELVDNNCIIYFPPNRFEEPGWLNYDNLTIKADFRFIKRVLNFSNRRIINYSPLKDNQNWLLDILFDKFVLGIKTEVMPVNDATDLRPVIMGYEGESNIIYDEILRFLNLLYQTDNIRFGVGKRRSRIIEVMKNDLRWIPNIFNMSTGESILLNIFLTIIKDYDMSTGKFNDFNDVRGVVIIDEVDIHLHSNLQYFVLPQLFKVFPKVQFILTSHSPLFLLGLKNEMGSDNFEILNLPEGNEIDVEDFLEFEKAFNYFKESIKYKEDIRKEIENSHFDLLFVEGDYDVKYLTKAAQHLNKVELLNRFRLIDSDGYGNIDKVSKHFDSKLADVTPQKIILLYDCDTQKSNSNRGKVFKRVVPSISESPITKGIENLFKKPILDKAMSYKNAFIDITYAYKRTTRGEVVDIPEKWEINKDEKGNLCNWICDNGTEEDFSNFVSIFETLESIINSK